MGDERRCPSLSPFSSLSEFPRVSPLSQALSLSISLSLRVSHEIFSDFIFVDLFFPQVYMYIFYIRVIPLSHGGVGFPQYM